MEQLMRELESAGAKMSRQREQGSVGMSGAATAGGGGGGSGTAALRELCILLAGNAELAREKLAMILGQTSGAGSLQDGSVRLNARQMSGVLALAQFIAHSAGADVRRDLWNPVVEFLRAIPYFCVDEFWHSATSLPLARSFFSDFMQTVLKIAELNATFAEEVSGVIAVIVPKIIAFSNRELQAPVAPGIKFFLVALAKNCPPLQGVDAEEVTKCLLDQWFLNFQRRSAQSATSSELSPHSSPNVRSAFKHNGRTPSSNGHSTPRKESYDSPNSSQNYKINGSGLSSRSGQTRRSPNSTVSTTPICTPVTTPSKLENSPFTPPRTPRTPRNPRSGPQNGTVGSTSRSRSVDQYLSAHSDEYQEGGSVLRSTRDAIEDESLQILERQELAFRLTSQIMKRTGEGRQLRDIPVHQLRNAAVTLLKSVLSLLKMRKQDWPADGEELKTKVDLKLQAAQEACVLQTRCLLQAELDPQSKGLVRESFPLSLDIADACLGSPWRKLKACEELFDSLLNGVAQVAAVLGSQIQRSVLLRLKSIVLSTCAQAEVFSATSHSQGYETGVKASCLLLNSAWESDKTSVESFLSSLAAHVRERVEQGEEERHVVFIQTNLTSFLSDVVEKLHKWETVELILPPFIECFEQRDISVPGPLRLKLIEALARLGTLGGEKSYREVVVLLTQDYLDKVSSIEATHSKALTSESAIEHLATLSIALVRFAHDVQNDKLRSNLRERLLTLCSNVGLLAEAKTGRIGANLLGPLLPAVAEICADVDSTQEVEPSLLKLFRNLWFYIALFGLAPPVQKLPSSSRPTSSPSRNSNSASSGNIALHAVGGAYMWNAQWSEAAKVIAKGTPPLVVSSVKWLEDEVELKALHNPGSRRGSNNEKAALTQRTALSAAIGGLLESSSLNVISGVKATYLLGVAILEILRLSQSGGVLAKKDLTGRYITGLTCAFKYLETPDLLPVVQQCLAAIVHQAFNAALSWLGERMLSTEEQVEEREAILAAHVCFLVKAGSSREENVRDIADSLLTQLRTRFPQVLWNPQCLEELLRVVVNVSQHSSTNSSGPHVGLRMLWSQRVREWMTHALIFAPCTIQGLLQEQFRNMNTWQKATQTSDLLSLLSDVRLDTTKTDGWSCNVNIPAVLAAAAAAAGTSRASAKGNNMEILSTGIISANVKSNHVGEITGMKDLYAGIGGLTLGSGLPAKHMLGTLNGVRTNGQENTTIGEIPSKEMTLHDMLTTRFVQLLQQFVVAAERGSPVDPAAFREACLRGAALLLSVTGITGRTVPEGFDQLLRLLCWCPAHIFTPQTMETGVFVWTWLLSAAPHLGSRVLAELVDAWLWTIDSKMGIFASGIRRSGPAAKLRPQLSPGEPEPAADEDLVQGIFAHNIWLGFLLDRYEVVKNASSDQLFLISRLLQGSVRSTNHFSCHPAATGTFFTLMLFGLKFCSFQANIGSSLGTMGVILLENRFYRAALGWFSSEPGWYDSNVEGALEAEAQTMVVFVQHLMTYIPKANAHQQISLRGRHGSASSHSNGNVDSSHSVQGKDLEDYSGSDKRKMLLLMLCQCEADRLVTWAHPLNKELASRPKISADQWSDFARTAWSVDPCIAMFLVSRFPAVAALKAEVTFLVQDHLTQVFHIPEALPYFVTPKAVEEDSPVLQYLPHWAPCSITRALEFLTPAYKGHHRVMAYVLRVMETYPPERVTFFMPQLVQSLRYDQKGLVEGYLIVAAQRSNLFAHILIWQLQGEEAPTAEEASREHHEVAKNDLYDIVPKVRQRIIDSFTAEAYDIFLHEFSFFDKVTSISGVLYPLPKDERRAGIRRELEKIQVESEDLYLPTAPNKLVRGIQLDSGIPLQSAAKVPIMITFDVVDKDGDPNEVLRQACIFKVGDDCRQDVLALQVIALLRDIYEAVGINLYLFPYGVLPTGYGRGIIEVVPNTRSRNQMAEITDGGLLENFQQDFGAIGSSKFEAARDKFIVSSAGYAVASLLLQPKDRHNGNLLFDKDGRLVHIDFGFILETSPGGNMRFESAHFKLSHEMTQLLDPSGIMKSEPWHRFVSLCVKGYLTARQHMDGILNTVLLMKDSGLPCFSRGDPIGNLRKRFHPEMSEREAANFMIKTCDDAYNKWTTTGYDLIQYLQQGIEK